MRESCDATKKLMYNLKLALYLFTGGIGSILAIAAIIKTVESPGVISVSVLVLLAMVAMGGVLSPPAILFLSIPDFYKWASHGGIKRNRTGMLVLLLLGTIAGTGAIVLGINQVRNGGMSFFPLIFCMTVCLTSYHLALRLLLRNALPEEISLKDE